MGHFVLVALNLLFHFLVDALKCFQFVLGRLRWLGRLLRLLLQFLNFQLTFELHDLRVDVLVQGGVQLVKCFHVVAILDEVVNFALNQDHFAGAVRVCNHACLRVVHLLSLAAFLISDVHVATLLRVFQSNIDAARYAHFARLLGTRAILTNFGVDSLIHRLLAAALVVKLGWVANHAASAASGRPLGGILEFHNGAGGDLNVCILLILT